LATITGWMRRLPREKSIQANAGLGAMGRSMIWNSIPFMTTVDVLIIAVIVYAIWNSRLIGPSKRPLAPKIGLRWIAFGLLAVCLFYFADLASMCVLPVVTSMQEAVEFMGTLHRDLSWLVVLFAMIAISTGFIELRRSQIELTEKERAPRRSVVQIGQIPAAPTV
jgi:hypothetical protein